MHTKVVFRNVEAAPQPRRNYKIVGAITACAFVALRASACYSQETSGGGGAEDLVKAVQNPIAGLISVPLQNNFDTDSGVKGDKAGYTSTLSRSYRSP